MEEPISVEYIPVKDELNKKGSLPDIPVIRPLSETNKRTDSFEFVNGPAKLKKKWVEFMGGQPVIDSMGLSKSDVKRQEVIYEMIDTERDYVNDLSIIIELYVKPLKSNNLISKKDLNVLFSNVEQIYGVNKELLSLFEKRQKENPYVKEIGDIWLTMNEYLKMYLLYCSNYATALTKLEDLKGSKNFSKFLVTQFQKPESRCLNLDSFLIKPVQRICKYPLLLKELLKYTDKNTKDYENLTNGYSKLQTVVTVVNGAAKVVEAVYDLIDLQSRFNPKMNIVSPSRKIKYKCEANIYLKKVEKNSSPNSSLQDILSSNHTNDKKKKMLFLLNDMIIIAKPLSQDAEKGKLKLLEKREMMDVDITTPSEIKKSSNSNVIELTFTNPDVVGVIFCEDENEKNELFNQLNGTLKEYQANNMEFGPKVVKRISSKKVYSMISNMSQDIPEFDDDEDEVKTKPTTKQQPVLNEELSSFDKLKLGVFLFVLTIVAVFTLALSINISIYLIFYANYVYAALLVILVASKIFSPKK